MRSRAFEQFLALEREHWWFRGRRAVYLELLQGSLGGRRPRRVLDIGAGVGGFLPELGAVGQSVHFTEFDAEAFGAARARDVAQGVRARAEALPFRDESYDLACLFDVVEHVADDARALGEVARVLRPGGRVVLSVPAHPWLFSRNDVVAGHVRRYTRDHLQALIRGAALELVRCTYTNALLFPVIAPTVLASKLIEPFAPDSEHTNLSLRLPRWLNELCFRAFRAELALSRRWDLPLGHSLFAIARRTEVGASLVGPAPRRPREAALLQPTVV